MDKITQPNDDDNKLICDALSGSKTALEQLVKIHYTFIYNVAFRLVSNHNDAQDLTQEALIKAITKLSQFNHQSNFKTWLYRIVFNHFINTKKRGMEFAMNSFEEFEQHLDTIADNDLNPLEQLEFHEKIEDAKIGCMTGMLLCLDREQRLIFTLGEIFRIDSKTGAEFLEITPENFRKILSRSRQTLLNFVSRKCGLINSANPCRCHKKIKGFINAGWVDSNDLQFNSHFIDRISVIASRRIDEFDDWKNEKYGSLFRDHPFYNKDKSSELVNQIVQDNDFARIFSFN